MIAGALLGAAIGGWAGFFALGFLGWLVGFIIKSNREPVPTIAAKPVQSAEARLQALERRVAALEKIASGTDPETAAASGSVPEPVVPAPVLIPEPIATELQTPKLSWPRGLSPK